jgi:hypothetical protein
MKERPVQSGNGGNGAGEARVAGLLLELASAPELARACERVRDAGYTRWDAHSPFPVHGLDRSMGLRSTVLPWLVMGAGVTGAATGIGLQWWTNAVNYQFQISGKPFWSIPANIPVTFELTVLFSAITAFLSMVVLNGLPCFHHPVFSSRRFRRATVDRFFISIEAEDPRFDREKTAEFLRGLGGPVETLEV